jgi:hypothetical protein
MSEESFTVFIKENGDFVIMLTASLATFVTATLVYVLKSRCLHIKCCCFECTRQPISEENLNSVQLNSVMPDGGRQFNNRLNGDLRSDNV